MLRASALSFGLPAVAVLLVAATCTPIRSVFTCHGDQSCVDGATQGTCELTGFCSFPDGTCATGRRYGVYAGGGLGSTCVGAGSGDDGGAVCGLLGDPCCAADMGCPGLTCDSTSMTCTGCVVQLALGDNHGCALKPDGTVWCWGKNDHGQLGDNSTTDRPAAVPVVDASLSAKLKGVTAITAGANHTCALIAGALYCWGDDSNGQLGRGGSSPMTPVAAPSALSSVVAIAAGGDHTCAITSPGNAVWCWGANDAGQLSTSFPQAPSSTPERLPKQVIDAGNVAITGIAITAGQTHTCLVKDDHSLFCWGSDTHGEIGDGSTATFRPPTQAEAISHVIAAAAGAHVTCALTDAGKVACVGQNDHGQTGSPGMDPVTVLALIAFDGATSVATGGAQGCARRVGARLECWGDDQAAAEVRTGVGPIAVGANDRCAALADSISCAVADPRLSCP
jgi:hypothetical protein